MHLPGGTWWVVSFQHQMLFWQNYRSFPIKKNTMLLCDLVEFWSSFWDAVLGKLVGGPVCVQII